MGLRGPQDAENERPSPERTDFLDDDHPRDECGIFGIYNRETDVARATFFGLHALQHRGQESAGIATSDGHKIRVHADLGLVTQVFREEDLKRLSGHIAIGHNRYSTKGAPRRYNAQPYIIEGPDIEFAFGHNGNVINAGELRREMAEWGVKFKTSSDSEVIAHLYANAPGQTWEERSAYCMRRLKGAYSLIFMTTDEVIGVRDPLGVRPLVLGRFGSAWILASETCALDIIGAEFIREIEPGEMVIITEGGVESHRPFEERSPRFCVFEYVYFSRPDSRIFDENVDKARRKLGKKLALEYPVDADIVISVPDSSNTAALGYASRSGIKFEIGLIRNHYVGRTFIHPEQSVRDFKVRVKFNPVEGVLKGRRVVLVDDSIVRGTTLKQLAQMLRKAGAKEVHVRVSSPPIIAPCYYGMDFPTKQELVASDKTVEKIREFLGVDSLGYLSLEGMVSAVSNGKSGFCTACFTGNYPLKPEDGMTKLQLEDEK